MLLITQLTVINFCHYKTVKKKKYRSSSEVIN